MQNTGGLWCETYGDSDEYAFPGGGSASGKDYTVFTDSQAAMARAQNDQPGPGQQRAIEIIEAMDTPVARGDSISIRWVPSHRGASSNETADRYAEAAAVFLGSGRRNSSLPISLTNLRRARTQRVRTCWHREIRNMGRRRAVYQISAKGVKPSIRPRLRKLLASCAARHYRFL